ncbi:MAG TPA: hypothetical protein VK752_27220 [Bryobacteraceae bacterium]|nr:hypothetical protein [Bryobacteraceae bacterium]
MDEPSVTVHYLDVPVTRDKVNFTEPMLLLPARTLPEGSEWTYELKFDGFAALAIKAGGEVRLRSRNDKDFNRKYPRITKAWRHLTASRYDLIGRPIGLEGRVKQSCDVVF